MALSEDRQIIADSIVSAMVDGKLTWADYKKASVFLYDMEKTNAEVMAEVELLLLASTLRTT